MACFCANTCLPQQSLSRSRSICKHLQEEHRYMRIPSDYLSTPVLYVGAYQSVAHTESEVVMHADCTDCRTGPGVCSSNKTSGPNAPVCDLGLNWPFLCLSAAETSWQPSKPLYLLKTLKLHFLYIPEVKLVTYLITDEFYGQRPNMLLSDTERNALEKYVPNLLQFSGWLVGWLVGPLVRWFIGSLVGLFSVVRLGIKPRGSHIWPKPSPPSNIL